MSGEVSGEDRVRGAAAILLPVCCAYCSDLDTKKLYENLNSFIKYYQHHGYTCLFKQTVCLYLGFLQ